MQDVKLKNGSVESDLNVRATLMAIDTLFNKNTPDILCVGLTDVLMGLEDPSYKTSDEMYAYLAKGGLAKKNAASGNYQIHGIVKNVMQSCFVREGFMVTKMISPIEGDDTINYSFNEKFAL